MRENFPQVSFIDWCSKNYKGLMSPSVMFRGSLAFGVRSPIGPFQRFILMEHVNIYPTQTVKDTSM